MGLEWYKPSIITTEESREGEVAGLFTTPDEIKEVKLAENGLILIGFQGEIKASKKEAGIAQIFIGSTALKAAQKGESKPTENAAWARTPAVEEKWSPLYSATLGLRAWEDTFVSYAGDVTTGQPIGAAPISAATNIGAGGFCHIFAASGTYSTVSVRFRTIGGGKVTARNRRLWVGTLS